MKLTDHLRALEEKENLEAKLKDAIAVIEFYGKQWDKEKKLSCITQGGEQYWYDDCPQVKDRGQKAREFLEKMK